MNKTVLKEIIVATKLAETSFRCNICNVFSFSKCPINGAEAVVCTKCTEKHYPNEISSVLNDAMTSKMIDKLENIKATCYAMLYKSNSKRNAKGETDLHRACKSKDLDRVCALLTLGAVVNVKDYAGWTPLHEAVHAKDVEIARELLQEGIFVDTPGDRYETPLQKAVVSNNVDMVKLLLEHGASINLRNYDGLTAFDLADDLMKQNLLNIKSVSSFVPTSLCCASPMKYTVCLVGFNDKMKQIESLTKQLKDVNFTNNLKPDVTHVVVPDLTVNIANVAVLTAILRTLPVVTYQWLEECAKQQKMVPAEKYYFAGTEKFQCDVMRTVEQNRNKLFPRLFDGINFYLTGQNELSSSFDVKISEVTLNQSSIQSLITEGGGILLTREPHTRNIKFNQFPWHAPRGSDIEQCCNYILYNRACTLKYNMKELRHMPADWLIECVWKYKLIPSEQMELHSNY